MWKTMVTGCLTATIMGSARSIRQANAIGTSLPQPAREEGGSFRRHRRAWPFAAIRYTWSWARFELLTV